MYCLLHPHESSGQNDTGCLAIWSPYRCLSLSAADWGLLTQLEALPITAL